MGDAITIKPMGPSTVFITNETTAFTAENPAATDAVLCLDDALDLGSQVHAREFVNESRSDRFRLYQSTKSPEAGQTTLEMRLRGSGTAGTPTAWVTNLLKNLAGMSETDNGTTSEVYEDDTENPATACTITRFDRNGLRVEQCSGAIATQLTISASRDEDPKIAAQVAYAKKVMFDATTLGAAVETTDGTSITISDPERLKSLSDAGTVTGLKIPILIDTEAMLLTGIVYSTGVCTVTRGFNSTTAATHENGATITPYMLTPTYVATNPISSYDWSATVDAAAARLRGFSVQFETGRAFDPVSSGATLPDSVHATTCKVSGNISFIRSTERAEWFRKVESGASAALVFTIGTTAGNIFRVTLPVVYFRTHDTGKIDSDKPTEVQIDFEAAYDATQASQIKIEML